MYMGQDLTVASAAPYANHLYLFLDRFSALALLVGWQEGHLACKN